MWDVAFKVALVQVFI